MASLALSIGLILFLKRREELAVPSWPSESIKTGMASAFAVVTPRMFPIKQLSLTFAPKDPIQITLSAVMTKAGPMPKAVFLLPVTVCESVLLPIAVFKLPSCSDRAHCHRPPCWCRPVLLGSVLTMAVFRPLVLLPSALLPTAVLLRLALKKSASSTDGGVEAPGGIDCERAGAIGRVGTPVVLVLSAPEPVAVFSVPSVLLKSARYPVAVLLPPVVLKASARTPLAVLLLPVVLLDSASEPLAVLNSPVVLLESALKPVAVLSWPLISLKRANVPLAVLPLPVV